MGTFYGLYITESINVKNMENAIKLIKQILERALGMKLYPYGPELYKNKFGTFQGIKYFLGNTNRAVRFNWQFKGQSTEIYSIDVWDDKEGSKDVPTITIQTAGVSLAKAIPQLAGIIKMPKPGLTIDLSATATVSEATVSIDGMEFKSGKEAGLYLASKGYSPEDIAKRTGMAIGGAKWVHGQYLKTVKGVSEKGIDSSEDKKAIQKFDKTEYADPDIVFDDLKDLVQMVASGVQASLLVTGMPGIGKTYSVTQHLEAFGKHKNEPNGYVTFKGTSSPFGLYRALYHHKNQIVLFDDCDAVLKDDTASNILKAALDSYDVREITWMSKSTFDPGEMSEEEINEKIVEEGKYPSKFEFKGQIIFISNIHKKKIEQAVISRSMTIDITLESKDVFRRMETILNNIEKDTPMKLKKEVLEYLKDEYSVTEGRQANMRTLLGAMKCRKSGSPNWKRLVTQYV
jgi:hypothetical protein